MLELKPKKWDRGLMDIPKIKRNSAKCAKCGDEIESTHRHDFVTCRCGEISIDGGKSYLKRSAKNPSNLIDTSITNEDSVMHE